LKPRVEAETANRRGILAAVLFAAIRVRKLLRNRSGHLYLSPPFTVGLDVLRNFYN
jgi:hypothetical protein